MNMKKEVMHLLSSLIIIFLDGNACPHVSRMIAEKLTDWGYKTLLHSLNSPHLSRTNIFSSIWTLFYAKRFCSKREVESSFKDFLGSKPFEFYCTGINYSNIGYYFLHNLIELFNHLPRMMIIIIIGLTHNFCFLKAIYNYKFQGSNVLNATQNYLIKMCLHQFLLFQYWKSAHNNLIYELMPPKWRN